VNASRLLLAAPAGIPPLVGNRVHTGVAASPGDCRIGQALFVNPFRLEPSRPCSFFRAVPLRILSILNLPNSPYPGHALPPLPDFAARAVAISAACDSPCMLCRTPCGNFFLQARRWRKPRRPQWPPRSNPCRVPLRRMGDFGAAAQLSAENLLQRLSPEYRAAHEPNSSPMATLRARQSAFRRAEALFAKASPPPTASGSRCTPWALGIVLGMEYLRNKSPHGRRTPPTPLSRS